MAENKFDCVLLVAIIIRLVSELMARMQNHRCDVMNRCCGATFGCYGTIVHYMHVVYVYALVFDFEVLEFFLKFVAGTEHRDAAEIERTEAGRFIL